MGRFNRHWVFFNCNFFFLCQYYQLILFLRWCMLLAASQKIGAGLSTAGLAGCGVGIGLVFAGLLVSSATNPFIKDDLFRVAMLGFALTEAVALFTLMVTFLILFG